MAESANQLKLYKGPQPVAPQQLRKGLNLPEEETVINVKVMEFVDQEKSGLGQEQVIPNENSGEKEVSGSGRSGTEKLSKDKDDGAKRLVNAFEPVDESGDERAKLVVENDVPKKKMRNESKKKLSSHSSATPVVIDFIDLVSDSDGESCYGECEYENEFQSPAYETFDQTSPPRVDLDSVPEYEEQEVEMESDD